MLKKVIHSHNVLSYFKLSLTEWRFAGNFDSIHGGFGFRELNEEGLFSLVFSIAYDFEYLV